jgi:type I restriction enzyme, S subunit
MSAFPKTWAEVRVGDVFAISTGKLDANAAVDDGQFPFFTCAEHASRIDQFSFDCQAVLLAGNGGFNVKKYDGKFDAYQRTYVLEPTGLDLHFAYNLIRKLVPEITSSNRGSTIKYLRLGDITEVTAKIPPLPEQRRIVAKLDRLSARSAAARDHLAHTTTLATRAKQAILAAAFDGALSANWRSAKLAPDWSLETVGKLVPRVTAGKNMKCEERPPMEDENGVVKVSAVSWGRFDALASKTLPTSFSPPPTTLIENGDLLFSRANTIELVGACVIVENAKKNLYLSDKVLRLEVRANERPWLMYYLRSPKGRSYIESESSGNQLSMRNLSQKALFKMPLPWPSEGERNEIVRRIEVAFARIDRLTEEATRAAYLVDRLDERLLAKAFAGELVLQDPNDEPAETLLARIRETRAAAPKPTRRRKKKAAAE